MPGIIRASRGGVNEAGKSQKQVTGSKSQEKATTAYVVKGYILFFRIKFSEVLSCYL